MTELAFSKLSGSGNDFILVDNRDGRISREDLPETARRLCRRKFSVGADAEVSGGVALRRDLFQWGQFAVVGGDFEYGYGVVAAVGGVKEVAVGVDEDFGGRVGAVEIFWEGGDGLAVGERAFFRVVIEYGDGRGEFVEHVGAAVVFVEGHVAGAGGGGDFGEGRAVHVEL